MREARKVRRDGVNDYYVEGEARQGITFYVLALLIVALIVVLVLQAYEYLPSVSVRTLWAGVYLLVSMAVGATVGIFAYNAFSSYKFIQIMLRNSLRATEHSFPEVFEAVRLASGRLSMEAPAAYVTQSPAVNAYSVRLGLAKKKKVIMLNTGLLKAMEGDELLFIIGHELSHVKYGRWRRFRNGLPYLISPQLNEYRSDRGGLAASRSLDASVRALLKLVTGKEFVDRVDVTSLEREKAEPPSKVLQKLSTHPMIAARVKELMRFYDSPEYKKRDD